VTHRAAAATVYGVIRVLTVAFVCAIAAAAAAGTVQSGVLAGSTDVTTTFRDTTGENAAGPDVTTVTVTSDGQELTLRLAVPSNATLTDDMRIRVWLDEDDDRTTGLTVEGIEGFDAFLLVDPLSRGPGAFLYSCAGTVCHGTTAPVGFSYADGATFRIAAASLDLPRFERIAFSAHVTAGIARNPVTHEFDFTNARIDNAPDQGVWTYDTRPLRVTRFRSSPARPRAGEPFALVLHAIRTDTGAPPARADVACVLRVGGKAVPGRASFTKGTAACRFHVRAGSRGLRFRSSIRVGTSRGAASRSLSGRVG
jgi:hypothetical protein